MTDIEIIPLATEVFGVKAVAALLAKRFPVQTEFIDMGIRF